MSRGRGMIIAAPERWDETCFAVPALRALYRSGLMAAIVCHAGQELFWKTVCETACFTFSNKTSVGQLASAIGNDWDASLVWEHGIAARAFAKAKIQRRLGPTDPKLKKLLTHTLNAHESPTEHRVRLYLNTLEEMGISATQPEYFLPASLGIPAKPKSVLLCPDSDFGPSHEWPLDGWQVIAESLIAKGKKITVATSIGSRNLGKILADQLGEEVEIFHASPLDAALTTLATFQLIIASDGSLPHLAAYTGGTCVTLFGPNDPNWKRPLGKQHVVVKQHAECSPCLSAKCMMDHRCQNELQAKKVLETIPNSF